MKKEISNTLVIDKETYSGYLWYSNKTVPEVLRKQEFGLKISAETNPFVVEAQLFDGVNSISVKYIDGKYHIVRCKVASSDIDSSNVELVTFIPNRMKDVSCLCFLQYWEHVADDLCEGMDVLQPTKSVFIGFDKTKKKKEEILCL